MTADDVGLAIDSITESINHLERSGKLERLAAAKAELLKCADVLCLLEDGIDG